MKLNELAGVEEERLTYVTSVLSMAEMLCSDVKEMTKIVRDKLEGNERDLAMMKIGIMLKEGRERGV